MNSTLKIRIAAIAATCVTLQIAGPVVADDFVGPVYGLATSPNGDILAADVGAGILEYRDGEVWLNAALPGVSDVSPIGRGTWWAVVGGIDGLQHTDVGQAVYRVSRGSTRLLANLFEFERANDPMLPPGGRPESNPFDVQNLGGGSALVVDSAGNDLLQVDDEGNVTVVAVFPMELVATTNIKNLLGCPPEAPFPPGPCSLPPMIPVQPVPTSVAVGPDGYYYVGELKGFPAPLNESRIWRIAPGASWAECGVDPECELVFDGGFTSIIDLAFGPDGLLYVVELDENSWFVNTFPAPQPLAGGTISRCDVETPACVERATGIPLPTAITFGKDGTLWSTEFALIPSMATVVEVP